MITFAAQVISVLFHPAVISIATPIVLMFFIQREVPYHIFWFFFPLIFVGIVILFTYVGVRTKLFSDFDVTKRSERKPLYFFVIIISLLYIALLFFFQGPKSLIVLGVGVLTGAIIFELVNKKLKASIHVAAVSAFFCVLALLYGGIFFFFPLLIPVIAWSRIHMKRHTFSEAVVGGSVGIGLTLVMYLMVEYILYLYG